MQASRIRRRIATLRERNLMTQAELAHALGLKDRQTVSAIESGTRKVSADELVRLADIFDIDLSVFSDPYLVFDEVGFSWRRNNETDGDIEQFENLAKNWLALYRHLSRIAGEPTNSLVPKLDLTEKSSFEDAASEGESIAAQFDLGPVPSLTIEQALTECLSAVVLNIDAPSGISGAACRLGGLNFVLVNRAEPSYRRAFNMAHELFHLATWEQMPPAHIESVRLRFQGNPRPEQLANAFASGLLMPKKHMQALIRSNPKPEPGERVDWINSLARQMAVSAQAMSWRLVELGILSRAEAQRMNGQNQRIDLTPDPQQPLPFSQRFVERLRWGLDGGHLTVRRAAQLMAMTIDELEDLFKMHEMPVPFDL